VPLSLGILDRVLEAVVVHGGVDRGRADVGVAGGLADDVDRDAGVRQVLQKVWRSTCGERRSSGSPAAAA
jgi:hypothetical protein